MWGEESILPNPCRQRLLIFVYQFGTFGRMHDKTALTFQWHDLMGKMIITGIVPIQMTKGRVDLFVWSVY